MHIEFENDLTLKMEDDYGGIRIQFEIENDIEVRHLIFPRRNYHDRTKGGIKVHLSRKHNELQKRYNPECHSVLKYSKTLAP